MDKYLYTYVTFYLLWDGTYLVYIYTAFTFQFWSACSSRSCTSQQFSKEGKVQNTNCLILIYHIQSKLFSLTTIVFSDTLIIFQIHIL